MTGRAVDLGEFLGVGEIGDGGEVLVAVHAGQGSVLGRLEDFRVDRDRRAVVALGVGVAVTGEAIVVGGRLRGRSLRAHHGRQPHYDQGRGENTSKPSSHDGLLLMRPGPPPGPAWRTPSQERPSNSAYFFSVTR